MSLSSAQSQFLSLCLKVGEVTARHDKADHIDGDPEVPG
jgi:hypothetical protein